MGHNGHRINLHGVVMILMGNVHAGGQSNLGELSLVHRPRVSVSAHTLVNSHIRNSNEVTPFLRRSNRMGFCVLFVVFRPGLFFTRHVFFPAFFQTNPKNHPSITPS